MMSKIPTKEELLHTLECSVSDGLGFDDWLKFRDFEARIVRVYGEIDMMESTRYLRELEAIRAQGGVGPVSICICSEGGSVYNALAIYDSIRFLAKDRNTVGTVEGYAASAAAMIILQACEERLALKNARFLIHEVRHWAFGDETLSEVKDKSKEMETLAGIITGILASRTGKTVADVHAALERRELWMGAEEAKEFGLIDGILE